MYNTLARVLHERGLTRWDTVQLETDDATVWWIFGPSDKTPAAVGKLSHSPQATNVARNEAKALSELNAAAPELNIPTLLFRTDLPDDCFLSVQSGVPGLPLRTLFSSEDRGGLWLQLNQIDKWLALLQQRVITSGNAGETLDYFVSLCQSLSISVSPAEERLISVAEELRPQLQNVPAVAVHGDFWGRNVLTHDDTLSVIDWANFHYGGPTEDLYSFVAAIGCERAEDPEAGAASMWNIFFGSSALGQMTATESGRVLSRWGLTRDDLGPLFHLFLVSRLAFIEFSNHSTWRAFIARYVANGMPIPFGDHEVED